MAPQAVQDVRRSANGETFDGLNLALHRRGVARHVGGEAGQLRADQAAEGQDGAQRERHGQQDGRTRGRSRRNACTTGTSRIASVIGMRTSLAK